MNCIMIDQSEVYINWYESSILKSLAIASQAYDHNYSYEEIMLRSGLAFRIQFHKDWCPSSANAMCGVDLYEFFKKDFSYDITNIEMEREQIDIINEIHSQIDAQNPVIFMKEESGIVLGYETGYDSRFLGRSYWDFRDNPGMLPVTDWPWQFCYLIPKGKKEELSEESLLKSLKNILEIDQNGDYLLGEKAIERWIYNLENLNWNSLQNEQKLLIIQSNAHIYFSLMYARELIVNYFSNPFNGTDFPLINYFQEELMILKEGSSYVKWPWEFDNLEDWSNDMIDNQINILNDLKIVESKIKKRL